MNIAAHRIRPGLAETAWESLPGPLPPLPIADRNRRREAALAGLPFQDCSRSGSPSPLRLPEQVLDRFLRLRAAHDPRRA
jgi:hypothetical protein